MKKIAGLLLLTLTLAAQQTPPPAGGPPQGAPGQGGPGRGQGRGGRGGGGGFGQVAKLEEKGFKQIFDGSSLKGWDCDTNFWRVEGGALVGETMADKQPAQNIFCIWRDGKPADFELKLEYRITGADTGNSGVQFRSAEMPEVAKWVLKGYQADFDTRLQWAGQLYEERGRGFLALRGMMTYIGPDGTKGSIGSLGDGEELKKLVKDRDWNEMHIIARGNTIIQLVNGRVMSQIIDDDKAGRKMDGLIGVQLHRTTGPMKIEARNIRLKDM
jgi:hypothetical protein